MENELAGIFPVYDKAGRPVAFIHCYKGQEEKCRRRAAAVGKAIANFNGEKYINNTRGTYSTPDVVDKLIKKLFK